LHILLNWKMIGSHQTQLQDINMIDFDFEDLSEAELHEILVYSESEMNLETRYVVACQIIANMIEDLNFETFSNSEMVDMTICKMLIDGYVEVEQDKRKLH